jgi:hypothetical protein
MRLLCGNNLQNLSNFSNIMSVQFPQNPEAPTLQARWGAVIKGKQTDKLNLKRTESGIAWQSLREFIYDTFQIIKFDIIQYIKTGLKELAAEIVP